MGHIKVEKGIPIPRKYPFADMAPGDSFLVPADTARSTVTVAAQRYREMHNMKFTVRKTPEGLRCWRVQ